MRLNDLTNRFFSTIKTHKIIATLSALLLAQQLFIAYKNYTINDLVSQNESLQEDMDGIQEQLSELEDSASDIRMFQSEMVKILKSIHHSYPMKFVTERNEADATVKKISLKDQIKNAYESLFRLSSSQKDLHKENANLLASAVFIKRILRKTPTLNPVSHGRISSHFGMRNDPLNRKRKRPHHGLDIAAPIGTPVFASADGWVKKAAYERELGWMVVIEHSDGFITRYGHLSKRPQVKMGEKVKQGQEIASVGNTGSRCTGAHLHYEISKDGVKIDPKILMRQKPASPGLL